MIDQDECARIRVVQSGGFAGTVTLADVDRASLDPAKAGELDQIGRELSSVAAPAASGGGEIGADLPQYQIEIQSAGGGSRSFQVTGTGGVGGAAGPDINAIIGRLNALSR